MNLHDFDREFDLLFNNAMGFSSEPINSYEKSLFLTQAEEELVLDLNKVYETDEVVREQLRNIVPTTVITYDPALNAALAGLKFNVNSKFFEVPSDMWFIKSEYINGGIEVIPTPIDEFNINIKNPFKMPTLNERAWRLDLYDNASETAKNIREIIYPGTISTYTVRYLKKPSPIILEDLAPYQEEIEGVTAPSNCLLSSETHRAILKRAVDKAVLAFRENTLQSRLGAGGRDN